MNIIDFSDVQPYVRMVKIKKAVHLEGVWEDFDYVLIYNMLGSLDWVIAGNRYHLEQNGLILIPPYMHHHAIKTTDKELVQYIVHFDLYEDAERMGIPHRSAFEFEEKPPLPERERLLGNRVYTAKVPENERINYEKLFLSMYGEFFQHRPYSHLMLKGCQMQLLSMTLRLLFNDEGMQTNRAPNKKSKAWKLVDNALEYICLHLNEYLNNNIISEAMGVSPNYLSKLFQQYIGMPMHTYVLNYRVDRAVQILSSGKCNITETAMQCGFSSVHAFSKAFKNIRGVCPSEYMDMTGIKNAAPVQNADYDLQQQVFYNQ